MIAKIIKLLGGYTKDDVLSEAMKDLFNTIGAEDILKEEKGNWVVGGKPITEGEKSQLIAEAKMLLNSRLWKVLQNDVKYNANKLMFEKAKSETDLIAGKIWLYTLDCLKTRLESLKEGRGAFNGDAR